LKAVDVLPVAVAFPPGTAAFRIKRGDKVLRVVPVSSNAPTITLTAAPAPGQVVSGVYTITWQSDDADSDLLHHIVEYSHNGRDWFVLASNITVTQTIEDFDALPGGQQARFRVFVSDGVNSAEATSAAFVVPPKPPEVFIESPKPGARYMAGTNVPLSGWANDEQDGNLYSSDALVWYSDQDGILARGPDLNTHTLSVGTHTITLSATNSAGLTGSTSVTITIEAFTGTPSL
jgi:chitinase